MDALRLSFGYVTKWMGMGLWLGLGLRVRMGMGMRMGLGTEELKAAKWSR